MHELGIAEKISQADFDAIADAVEAGMSARTAVINANAGLPDSTVRRWLRSAGVAYNSDFTRSSMSAHQIRTAMTAQADYISREGTTRGSVRAAYQALGGESSGVNRSTFRDYFTTSGLTPHGRAVLEGLDGGRSSGPVGSSNPDAGR